MLIDNIFIPLELVSLSTSYIIIEDMSDHLPTLLVLNGLESGKKREYVVESRDMRPKNIKALKDSMKNENWHASLSNVIPPNDDTESVIPQNVIVNAMFDNFHRKIQNLLGRHVSI